MELAQWIEIGAALTLLGSVFGAYYKVKGELNAAVKENDRMRRLIEGTEGDGGFKKRINELEAQARIQEGLASEIHNIKRTQETMYIILQRIADKLDIDIPLRID